MKIAKLIAAAGVCCAVSVAVAGDGTPDVTPIMDAPRELRPLQIAQITKYYSPTHFEIGPWIDVADREPTEAVLAHAFDQLQTDVVVGNPILGCNDGTFPDGARYILSTTGTTNWYNGNILAQNDMTSIAAGANGALVNDWHVLFGIHATSDFIIAATMFEDVGPDQLCSPAASSFLGGVIANFGFQVGDLDGTTGGYSGNFFFSNIDALPAAGINIPLPADGSGTYQYAYGQAFDAVNNILTLHAGSQPGLWNTSEWGGIPGRPGTTDFVAYADEDQNGVLDPALECFDWTFGAQCAEILEIGGSMTFDDAGPTCECTAHLVPSGGCETNTNDFFAFLALFQAQDPQADFFPGGGINTNDFFAYLAAYQADLNNPNCPG